MPGWTSLRDPGLSFVVPEGWLRAVMRQYATSGFPLLRGKNRPEPSCPWIVERFGGVVGVLKPATWRHCGLRDSRPNCSEYATLLTFGTAEEAWDWMRGAAGRQFDTGCWRINRLPERTDR